MFPSMQSGKHLKYDSFMAFLEHSNIKSGRESANNKTEKERERDMESEINIMVMLLPLKPELHVTQTF